MERYEVIADMVDELGNVVDTWEVNTDDWLEAQKFKAQLENTPEEYQNVRFIDNEE